MDRELPFSVVCLVVGDLFDENSFASKVSVPLGLRASLRSHAT